MIIYGSYKSSDGLMIDAMQVGGLGGDAHQYADGLGDTRQPNCQIIMVHI